MDLGLSGKVALVAASSRGLGKAVALELGREGAQLIMCARGEDALRAARDEIAAETGAEPLAVAADLSEAAAVEQVVAAALDRFGRVDVLVTNTGGPPPGPFESHTAEAWREAVRQNLESVLNLTRGVLPGMPSALEFFALEAALDRIEAEGLEAVVARHTLAGAATRDAIRALGLST